MSHNPHPRNLLNDKITSDMWSPEEGPIEVGNQLRGYIQRARSLDDEATAALAENKLNELRQLRPDIDDLFRKYDENSIRIRRELGR